MPARVRRVDRGSDSARRLLIEAGRELRLARIQHGLALGTVAGAAALSAASLSRIERGLLPGVPVANLARLAAAVGLELTLRLYPLGDPLRDSAHNEVIGRLRGRLHPGLGWGREVPFPRAGDLRAWDAVIRGKGWVAGVEVETRPRDLQALLRRIAHKERDGGVDLVILVLGATRYNRRLVRDHAADLIGSFPASQESTLERLAKGLRPLGSCVLLL
jgi:transcriptional regulator with XRE-family HTH domain